MWDDKEHLRRLKLIEKYDFEKEVIKNLKSCPFCGCKMDGSVYPPNLTMETWRLQGDKMRIICPRCGAAGPDAYTVEWAVTNWNERGEREENEISH